MDWHPNTGDLWFTDNGRDGLGEITPPDEVNVAWKPNMNFGFPYCYGNNSLMPDFPLPKNERYVKDENGNNTKELLQQCSFTNYTPAVIKIAAHSAPLGLHFYTGNMFPDTYKNTLLVAEHGSWGRVVPSGYQVINLKYEENVNNNNNNFVTNAFVSGWFHNGGGKGCETPVDFLQLEDGSLLISGEQNGVVYRVYT